MCIKGHTFTKQTKCIAYENVLLTIGKVVKLTFTVDITWKEGIEMCITNKLRQLMM